MIFITRLHVRYDNAHFPEDLMFQGSIRSGCSFGKCPQINSADQDLLYPTLHALFEH